MWVDDTSPTEAELVASLARLEAVLAPAQAVHYSNLAFALLGRVVAARSGVEYQQYVDERIIGPLGLERTTWMLGGAARAGLPRLRVRPHRVEGA